MSATCVPCFLWRPPVAQHDLYSRLPRGICDCHRRNPGMLLESPKSQALIPTLRKRYTWTSLNHPQQINNRGPPSIRTHSKRKQLPRSTRKHRLTKVSQTRDNPKHKTKGVKLYIACRLAVGNFGQLSHPMSCRSSHGPNFSAPHHSAGTALSRAKGSKGASCTPSQNGAGPRPRDPSEVVGGHSQ